MNRESSLSSRNRVAVFVCVACMVASVFIVGSTGVHNAAGGTGLHSAVNGGCSTTVGSYAAAAAQVPGGDPLSTPADSVAPLNAHAAGVYVPQYLGRSTIADIAARVAPAVVNIELDQDLTGSGSGAPGTFKFFINGKEINPGNNGIFGFPQSQIDPNFGHVQNAGSGVIVRPDGYILTNSHVVKNKGKITVRLHDQRTFTGTVIGVDAFSDLAVVKIDGNNLPTVKLGTSSGLRPGDFVIAIGNPFGFDHTVTFGIVSAIKRSVTDVNGNINFIQTDAAINPGNSGGPLLNLDGDVVGINTAIKSNAQNIGFSIPIDIAKDVADSLISHKKIERPWLGIGMRTLDDTMLKSQGLAPGTQGTLIYGVVDGSPAKSAGLQPGDIIVKIDGKGFNSPHEVQDYVRTHQVGDTLHVYLLRQGAPQAVTLKIGQYPEQAPTHLSIPDNGNIPAPGKDDLPPPEGDSSEE